MSEYVDWDGKVAEKVSWNDLKVGECFLGPGGMYKKATEDVVFYFNGHTEIDIDEDNRDNKVFTRTDK